MYWSWWEVVIRGIRKSTSTLFYKIKTRCIGCYVLQKSDEPSDQNSFRMRVRVELIGLPGKRRHDA